MNGAESMVRTAVAAGVDVCFANPGTTEMPLVAALDTVPGMRAVLGLFEGAVTGAADGYGRMAGRPALTLLHLGPGFANGIANLHNARRARTPLVNLVGDQATWHRSADAPLTSDIASLAHPVSSWVRSSHGADKVALDIAEAIAEARRPPGGVTTLVVPADCQWGEAVEEAVPVPVAQAESVPTDAVVAVARRLSEGRRTALFLGGRALGAAELRTASRIAAATGAQLFCETFPARLERGVGVPAVEKLAYFPEQALAQLDGVEALVLIGAPPPVAFFGYPDQPSSLVPQGTDVITLARPEHDVAGALEDLADELGAALEQGHARTVQTGGQERPVGAGALTPAVVGQALAAVQPEGAILVDEAITTGMAYFAFAATSAPHTYLSLTGGAIGQGLPSATGAAVACPDRRVIAFQADGSGLYTLQSLWTQARESLDVTTLICANRRYRILDVELARAGVADPGPKARSLTDLASPPVDWVHLAQGLGVPAERVERADDLLAAIDRSLAEHGPRLIEMVM